MFLTVETAKLDRLIVEVARGGRQGEPRDTERCVSLTVFKTKDHLPTSTLLAQSIWTHTAHAVSSYYRELAPQRFLAGGLSCILARDILESNVYNLQH